MGQVTVGVDIGTTKIGLAVREITSGEILYSSSLPTMADLDVGPGKSEQDVRLILEAIRRVFSDIPSGHRGEIAAVGVSGQMHGVLLWRPGNLDTSSLVTWQDRRAGMDGSLESINGKHSANPLRDGEGNTTLAWMSDKSPEILKYYPRASTVHDFFVSQLTGSDESLTDPTNAASWGLFDIRAGQWREDALRALGIPENLTPRVVETGALAGRLTEQMAIQLGLTPDIPVAAAIGDNQAGLYGTITDPNSQIALSLGTSAQLSVVLDEYPEALLPSNGGSRHEIRPYVDGKYIAVAAALSGGNVFESFVRPILGVIKGLGLVDPTGSAVDSSRLLDYLTELALSVEQTDVRASPYYLGERHDPRLRAGVTNLSPESTCADMFFAMAKSVVENIRAMLPPELLDERTEILCSGGVVRKNALIKRLIEEVFGMPVCISGGDQSFEEAAAGAAKLASRLTS